MAELVSCPLQGDWGFDFLDALYKEGLDRSSNYSVYKSHQTYKELKNASNKKNYKIIYIIRDPRDVVVSGMNYFTFIPQYFQNTSLLMRFNLMRRVVSKLVTQKEKKKEMINAVLYGNKSINHWLAKSWKSHYETYEGQEILFVKFEDLITSPEDEAHKILRYLDVQVSDDHIKESIFKQSFQYRKRTDTHKKHNKMILRKGEFGYWKEEFSEDEKNSFKNVKSVYYKF